jgi:hypothetical protein
MKRNQKEVQEAVMLEDEDDLRAVMRYLAPWVEKTDGIQSIGNWETSMSSKMMVMILEMWLTEENREQLENILKWYHPLDRSAMVYALIVYVMTGRRMELKNKIALQHYKMFIEAIKDDMPELSFANHMKYMMRKYGPKKK